MSEVVSKCGMNCARCPWSPITRKRISPEEFSALRNRAKAILGFTPTENPCLLCLTPDEKISKKDATHWYAKFRKGCQVRKCVTNMGIKNCAYCSRFPCAFEKAHASVWTREVFEKQHGRPLTDEEYHSLIEPFEALKRLERIRATLSPDEIVKAKTDPPLKAKVVTFPDEISSPQSTDFKQVHSMLSQLKRSTLSGEDADLAPQQHRLKTRVKTLFRFIWILTTFGKLSQTDEDSLVIDAETFQKNKKSETALSRWDALEQMVFPTLAKIGLQAELVELAEEWKVPTGYLRSKGWEIKLSFTKKSGGKASLKALQTYGKKLTEKYGKRAFRYFKDVDMRVLTET